MEKIEVLTFGDELWNRVIKHAETCSWGAGRVLAGKMRANDFEANEKRIKVNIKTYNGVCCSTFK